jgi:hypothetical protein
MEEKLLISAPQELTIKQSLVQRVTKPLRTVLNDGYTADYISVSWYTLVEKLSNFSMLFLLRALGCMRLVNWMCWMRN